MFWVDKIIEEFVKDRKEALDSKESIVIRDEKTASGRVHVGAMRGVALHGAISRVLSERGIQNTFLYEINDFDAFDTVPVYLDKEKYESYLGMPLYALPAPTGEGNYPQYFGNEFARVIKASGFSPQFYFSSDEYKAGKYNDAILKAIEKAGVIRNIYKETSGGERPDNWLPIMVVCERCGKVATTRATSFDGKSVHYYCDQEGSGTIGCGYEGDTSPFDGKAKLPWKVEWAAKFKVFDVDIEGEGKDLATKGGARDVAERISTDVFEYKPPFNIPYEFLLIGDKKMSTSKGAGASASEVASLVPAKIFQLALLGRNIKRAINFDPSGDTIPTLYDQYDKFAEKFIAGIEDDDTKLFSIIHKKGEIVSRFLPRFSQVVFLVQMPHMKIEEEISKIKGSGLTNEDKEELDERILYAKEWINKCAPERYVFKLQLDSVPDVAKNFSSKQKEALRCVLAEIVKMKELDGQELHTTLHEIRKETNIEPQEFFSAIYLAFLGKNSGPKVGWFLSVLDRVFLESRLKEVTKD